MSKRKNNLTSFDKFEDKLLEICSCKKIRFLFLLKVGPYVLQDIGNVFVLFSQYHNMDVCLWQNKFVLIDNGSNKKQKKNNKTCE